MASVLVCEPDALVSDQVPGSRAPCVTPLLWEIATVSLFVFGAVFVFDEEVFDGGAKFGADVVADGPVGADVAAHDGDQFASDVGEDSLALDLDG
jgi:hypothetical protein